jgi:serine protease Do
MGPAAFDMNGNVIGVNTAIFSPSGGSVGIGFDVPADTAKMVVAQLKTKAMSPAAGSVFRFSR